jgi:hypothetical protein
MIGTKLLYHAQSQSTTAGKHLMEYLKDPAGFHDEGVRMNFEAGVSKHDNEQIASALMNSLPVEIAELLRLTHGTTVTGGTQLVSYLSLASPSLIIFGLLTLVLRRPPTITDRIL